MLPKDAKEGPQHGNSSWQALLEETTSVRTCLASVSGPMARKMLPDKSSWVTV